ncbi:flagellin [Candidatus Kurthia intestinigallinarum]|uniref:flagellin n=1 Tax=Candidatus Kurthia intestinigallinarum TaxID=1562256 RepID=UPI003516B8B8
MGNADYPDLNIVGPNGEIYGYVGSYLKSSSAQTINNLPSASSGTYSGHGSKIESFIFHDPKPGKWSIIIDYTANGPTADMTLNSNYSLNLPGTTPPTVQPPESLIIQKGPNAGHRMELELTDARTEALGIDGLDLSSREGADKAIALLDAASGKVSSERSKFGAYMNVLEHVQNNTGAYKESLTAAESRVRDTDIAKMSITLSRNQLILQAAQSVTSQANQMSQGILELLK